MDYLPIFTKLENRACLVVGGGDIALRKVHLLLKAGANVSICALAFHPLLKAKAQAQEVRLIPQAFSVALLDKQWLVIAATNDHDINAEVARAAEERQLLVNVVDSPLLSSFIMPSIVDRSPIIVAISSSGTAPVLARLIRERLEALLPMHIGRLAAISGKFRHRVKDKIKNVSLRRRYWEKLFGNGKLGTLLEQGKTEKAVELMENALCSQPSSGDVALVGAGPGDPSLLTLKALQLMQQADVVLYDRLVSSDILDLVRRDADLISVGKKAGDHYVEQARTNKMLIEFAQQGKKVVRLKGGDPFIFGRGGEELEELLDAGISFQVVPGITAASGCSAYAGIPLTHRDFAQSVTFVTGHQKSKGEKINWQALASPMHTLVVYMGLLQTEKIQTQLLHFGRDKKTPVALISHGTTTEQHVILGTLEELTLLGGGAQGPTLIIIGEVVSLANKLSWFNAQNATKLSRDPFLVNLS
ncbi:bifunctional siroheme synthase 1,3-dimethyluroporphyriongen III dehydrogenase/siroheme ferrochelatase/uroporphyrinogen methyltransferase [Psychromonas sp. CNPT3]|uniref:siroheme synthase CysG n=1 Tax=Psychromonas sp. CNPT3 TaxID=314282 RepID=UPI00006E581E|nr:siroheme synthase CysG [Psychromonas sp. CNPT3]AGH80437.1 bifunctional siroheme synthase 1,3-dimethyluroporphyriongen III dehydrogenase/siroheme ferrochelatase/uroporphyrinogen methyltransferase [Psychromonas sp. CNPT3]